VRSRPRQPPPGRTVLQAQLQLSVFVRAGDSYAGRPLYNEIVDRARAGGLRGATAVRGLTGFGGSGRLRAPGMAGRNGHEPVLIEITDDEARIRAFLPVLEQLVGSGLVVLRTVTTARRVADVPDITASAPA
jgi:PII-like signaling protein